MVWCNNCAKNITRPDYAEGKTCCSLCGKVLDDDNFSQASNGQRRTNSKSENEVLQSAKAGSTGMAIYPRVDATLEESESLSDIDDIEVDLYLHADEETKYKTRIWEIINKEYLEASNGQRRTNSKSQNEVLQSANAGSTGATGQHKTVNDATFEESESLSDIDDIEDDLYLHIDEETKYKTRIWEIINKDYLEEQAAKEAVELAAKKAYEAAFANSLTDELNRSVEQNNPI